CSDSAAVEADGVGAAAGDGTGEASGGRCGLATGAAAAAVGCGTVGVGAAAVAPPALVRPSDSNAHTAARRLLNSVRLDRAGRMLPSRETSRRERWRAVYLALSTDRRTSVSQGCLAFTLRLEMGSTAAQPD